MSERDLVPAVADSALALDLLSVERTHELHDAERDRLLYVVAGEGALELDGGAHALAPGDAALVLAGESASVTPSGELTVLRATIGPQADRHAPLGTREVVVRPGDEAEKATGARSFRIFFGPHNGSSRATLFAGYIPPGKAPWHYHLYDEIVWVPEGPGRLHVGDGATELGPGASFRLLPREVHIVENAGDAPMTVIGVFTPAGSPSAAYLTPEAAAEYRFAS